MNTEKVIKRDQKYIMHTYARSPLVLEHGEGMYAYDADGKALSGLYLRHWRKRAGLLPPGLGTGRYHAGHPFAAFFQPVLHRPLRQAGQAAVCPHRLDQVFFGNSGAEANEGAIKCARKYSVTTYGPDRNKVLTLVNSFHGRTLATLTATGQDVFHKDFGPFPLTSATSPPTILTHSRPLWMILSALL